jgi:hypothetical protein
MALKPTKPHFPEAPPKTRRERQREIYLRYQVFGLLLVAAAILVWGLLHTHPTWIFTAGWWRL